MVLPSVVAWGLGAALIAVGVFWKTILVRRGMFAVVGAGILPNVFGSGTNTGGAQRILEAHTGESFGSKMVTRLNRESAWRALETGVAAGKKVPTALMLDGTGGHQVLVEGIANGVVTFANPWGSRMTMTVAYFEQSLVGMNLPG